MFKKNPTTSTQPQENFAKMLTAINPFILLFVPGLLIVFSSVCLMQFGVAFQKLSSFARASHGGSRLWKEVLQPGAPLQPLASRGLKVWKQYLQPVLKNFVVIIENSVGPADKFKANLTHVLLVSLIFVILASAAHIHKAVMQAAKDTKRKTH